MSDAQSLFVHTDDFVPSEHVKFNKPRQNKAGGKSVGILNSKTNRQLHIQTPLMMTWGINRNEDEKTGRVSFNYSLQFPSTEYETETTKKFLQSIQDMENLVKEAAVENSRAWMNKAKITKDQVDVLFHPMLKWPRDKETGDLIEGRGPTFRVKLDYWDEEFNCELYDMKGEQLFPSDDDEVSPETLISKGSSCISLIKCGGVWFANGKFGVTWKLVQCVVQPRASLKGRCFINVSKNEKQKLQEQAKKDEERAEEDDAVQVEAVDDSDDDDEGAGEEAPVSSPAPEPEPEPEPEPAPAPKKKKVVRKKIVRRTKKE